MLVNFTTTISGTHLVIKITGNQNGKNGEGHYMAYAVVIQLLTQLLNETKQNLQEQKQSKKEFRVPELVKKSPAQKKLPGVSKKLINTGIRNPTY